MFGNVHSGSINKEKIPYLTCTSPHDRYMRLTKSVPVTDITLTSLANILVGNWVMAYSIRTYLLTDHGLHFVSKFFAAMTMRLRDKYLTKTVY